MDHFAEIQRLISPLDRADGIELAILREDERDYLGSGNKLRKLKYHLQYAETEGIDTLLSFGGAFSNHISALAFIGKQKGFKTIGVIRGEELADSILDNPTLAQAAQNGMQFEFVSRSRYRQKTEQYFLDFLVHKYGSFYVIPEGGTDALGVKGCVEMLPSEADQYDVICVPVGTGGTLSGLSLSIVPHQHLMGFSALQGTFQHKEIKKHTAYNNYSLTDDYSFGGYGVVTEALVKFINTFKADHSIQLDPIYTGKMMFGIYDMLADDQFKKNTRILAVHTGGLQGIAGMNLRLKKKNLPQIV